MFPSFSCDKFEYIIDVLVGFISWFYEIQVNMKNWEGNLRKAPKLTYSAVHTENNKQNVTFTLAIFHEMASAAVKSYFPDRLDAATFLSLFHKVFVICNSKSQCNSSDLLGNAALPEDNKPGFLSQFAVWVESWSECIWSVKYKSIELYAYKANMSCANHYIRKDFIIFDQGVWSGLLEGS